MHQKSQQIIENLGFSDEIVTTISRIKSRRKTISALKKLGLPKIAIEQIKIFESFSNSTLSLSNKELIDGLIKKCKRSLDGFSNKKIQAKIIFKNNNWTIFSEAYTKEIQRLHEICKPHFDEFSIQGLTVILFFDGGEQWKVITNDKSDLPDNI